MRNGERRTYVQNYMARLSRRSFGDNSGNGLRAGRSGVVPDFSDDRPALDVRGAAVSSPWKDYPEGVSGYDPDRRGAKIAPPANRWLAVLICLAVVCAIVAVFA